MHVAVLFAIAASLGELPTLGRQELNVITLDLDNGKVVVSGGEGVDGENSAGMLHISPFASATAPPLSLVCGKTACTDDNDCNDPTGSCTYCTNKVCNVQRRNCGTPTPPPAGSKPYLMVGDSISIGTQGQLFASLGRGGDRRRRRVF